MIWGIRYVGMHIVRRKGRFLRLQVFINGGPHHFREAVVVTYRKGMVGRMVEARQIVIVVEKDHGGATVVRGEEVHR